MILILNLFINAFTIELQGLEKRFLDDLKDILEDKLG